MACAVWDAPAASGGTTLTLDPKNAALNAPIFRLTGFTSAQLTQVTVDGVVLQPGAGYFATVDAATQSVWITLNGTVSAPITLRVQP